MSLSAIQLVTAICLGFPLLVVGENIWSNSSLPRQCFDYRILDEADRSVNSGGCGYYGGDQCTGDVYNCAGATRWKGPGYYRLLEPAGTQLPETAPRAFHCGTDVVITLNGKHPKELGVEVDMTVTFTYNHIQDVDKERDMDLDTNITVTKSVKVVTTVFKKK